MGNSKIEWTEMTWNPVVGCSIVSPGCTNCYAMRDAWRKNDHPKIPHYHGLTKKVNGHPVWTGKLAMAPEHILLAPLKRHCPTTYFVNSMSDLFHEDCPDEWIDRIFAVMALTPQHTYQVLTKRAKRMREYMTVPDRKRTIAALTMPISCALARHGGHKDRIKLDHFSACFAGSGPFANVWLGVSTERQQEADERIPELLRTPAAVRFVSAEPLLGTIDLTSIRAPLDPTAPDDEWIFDALQTGDYYQRRYENAFGEIRFQSGDGPYRESKIDWVIVGGESGVHARPMHPDWARALRDQCASAEVPFFFKQWGSRLPDSQAARDHQGAHTSQTIGASLVRAYDETFWIVDKHRAGRILDGAIHDAMPPRDRTPTTASARMTLAQAHR